jgi:hypothetical protein
MASDSVNADFLFGRGIMNKIIAAAIHDLIKEEAGFTIKLAAKPLRHNATLQRVIDSISDQYARKTSKS